MKKTSLLMLSSVFMMLVFEQSASAQETKKKEEVLKNTIHFNLTNPLIFGGKALVIGYQRVLNNRQAFSFNIGTTDFPTLSIINTDSITQHAINDRVGFNVSADYRFYLAKENKYPAPRGVYVGPYYSYNYFKNENTYLLKNTAGGISEVGTLVKLNVHAIGFELGYQFVFWDRLSVDMVLLGPGIGTYKLQAGLGTNLVDADKSKLLEALNEALADRFPGYSIIIDDTEFKRTGTSNTTTLGYRYFVQVGFRF